MSAQPQPVEAHKYSEKVVGLAQEMKEMPWEPLLPVEKKLIAWSIGLGLALLGVLVWVSYTYFPAGH